MPEHPSRSPFACVMQHIASLSETVAAIEACLARAGLLTHTQVQIELHRQRFSSACQRSQWIPRLDAELHSMLYQPSLVETLIGFVGQKTAHCLALACCTALGTLHKHISHVLAIGGFTRSDVSLSHSVEGLSFSTGVWKTLVHKMPFGMMDCASVALGGCIYICGAGMESTEGRVVRFDPMCKPECTWEVLGPATGNFTPRQFPGAAALDGRLYVCGGSFSGTETPLNCVERIMPGIDDDWESLPSMSELRSAPVCFPYAGNLFACGGDAGEGLCIPDAIKQSCELYDPQRRLWRIAPSMLVPRTAHRGGAMRGCVYVAGGFNLSSLPAALQSAEFFSHEAYSWTFLTPMQVPRSGSFAVVFARKLYVFGGASELSVDARCSSTECFDPDTGKWSFAASMEAPRCNHSGGVLALPDFGQTARVQKEKH